MQPRMQPRMQPASTAWEQAFQKLQKETSENLENLAAALGDPSTSWQFVYEGPRFAMAHHGDHLIPLQMCTAGYCRPGHWVLPMVIATPLGLTQYRCAAGTLARMSKTDDAGDSRNRIPFNQYLVGHADRNMYIPGSDRVSAFVSVNGKPADSCLRCREKKKGNAAAHKPKVQLSSDH